MKRWFTILLNILLIFTLMSVAVSAETGSDSGMKLADSKSQQIVMGDVYGNGTITIRFGSKLGLKKGVWGPLQTLDKATVTGSTYMTFMSPENWDPSLMKSMTITDTFRYQGKVDSYYWLSSISYKNPAKNWWGRLGSAISWGKEPEYTLDGFETTKTIFREGVNYHHRGNGRYEYNIESRYASMDTYGTNFTHVRQMAFGTVVTRGGGSWHAAFATDACTFKRVDGQFQCNESL